MQEKINRMIIISKWLINGLTVETVVMLSNNFSKPKEYVQIGIDAEDYYKLKGINK